ARRATAPARDQGPGKRRPSGLMRSAEALAGFAVEVLIEEERIPPRRIVVEAGVWPMRRAPAIRVEQKQTQEPPLELRGDLKQSSLPARSRRQFDRQIFAEEIMKMPERLDREEIQGKPDRASPVGVAAEETGARLARLIVEAGAPAVEIQDQGMVLVIARQRSQAEGRQEFALVEHSRQDALKARFVDQRDQAGPAAGRQIVEIALGSEPVLD